jgi:hypothetical protein
MQHKVGIFSLFALFFPLPECKKILFLFFMPYFERFLEGQFRHQPAPPAGIRARHMARPPDGEARGICSFPPAPRHPALYIIYMYDYELYRCDFEMHMYGFESYMGNIECYMYNIQN